MKKILRKIIFAGIALYLTSLLNKGFILPKEPMVLLKLLAVFVVVYYLIIPISKIILLPLNILTLGLVSFLVYLLFFHLSSANFQLLTIGAWTFPGFKFSIINIGKTNINYFWNLILSSVSVSSIISLLEAFL